MLSFLTLRAFLFRPFAITSEVLHSKTCRFGSLPWTRYPKLGFVPFDGHTGE
jgi:hypothetical protein